MAMRPMRPSDREAVVAFMRELWSSQDDDVPEEETVFVWEREDGSVGGFVAVAIRPWADGLESAPVPYIEGWYVAEDLRRRGIGRALIETAVAWARAQGFHEIGSDVELTNEVSLTAHRRLGFEPTVQLQYLRRSIDSS